MSTLDRSPRQGFDISIHAREDGSLVAAYIQLREGTSVRTETILKNALLVDRDESDRVLGIEILAPVTLLVLQQVADHLEPEEQAAYRNFVTNYAPPSLLQTS
jgi:uncharacterized protein YuzE